MGLGGGVWVELEREARAGFEKLCALLTSRETLRMFS